MKRNLMTCIAAAAVTTLCLGSGLALANPFGENFNQRSRPLFAVHLGEVFFGVADVSNFLNIDECDPEQGAEQLLILAPGQSVGVDYTFAYVAPEVGPSCWMSKLPEHVTLIRVMGRCPDGVVELTSFDGTTITPVIGESVLVGDPMVLPDGCDDVIAREVVFDLKPPKGESIPGPLTVGP